MAKVLGAALSVVYSRRTCPDCCSCSCMMVVVSCLQPTRKWQHYVGSCSCVMAVVSCLWLTRKWQKWSFIKVYGVAGDNNVPAGRHLLWAKVLSTGVLPRPLQQCTIAAAMEDKALHKAECIAICISVLSNFNQWLAALFGVRYMLHIACCPWCLSTHIASVSHTLHLLSSCRSAVLSFDSNCACCAAALMPFVPWTGQLMTVVLLIVQEAVVSVVRREIDQSWIQTTSNKRHGISTAWHACLSTFVLLFRFVAIFTLDTLVLLLCHVAAFTFYTQTWAVQVTQMVLLYDMVVWSWIRAFVNMITWTCSSKWLHSCKSLPCTSSTSARDCKVTFEIKVP